MSDNVPPQVLSQIATLRDELDELAHSTEWRRAASLDGSRQLRSIAERIGTSAKRLHLFVKESTFGR
jgi:hypothetical protein